MPACVRACPVLFLLLYLKAVAAILSTSTSPGEEEPEVHPESPHDQSLCCSHCHSHQPCPRFVDGETQSVSLFTDESFPLPTAEIRSSTPIMRGMSFPPISFQASFDSSMEDSTPDHSNLYQSEDVESIAESVQDI